MDVLVNATTLVKGGGVQVATSFIVEAERAAADDIVWHYALSAEVDRELQALGVRPANSVVYEASPAKNKAQRRALLAREAELSPDVVFTVFGPAFVRFESPHLMGVGNGWVTHSTLAAFRSLGFPVRSAKAFLAAIYKGLWVRHADRWVVEAENSRQGLINRLRLGADKITVVPNVCGSIFREAAVEDAVLPAANEPVRLLYLAAWYGHKNIQSIPKVAAELKQLAPQRKITFVITVPDDEPALPGLLKEATRLGVSDYIENVGRVPFADIVTLYESCHACFMPSLLETFSANYPEAMATGRPLIASDFDFSRSICRDTATYFDASSPRAAAEAIAGLLDSPARWQASIDRGRSLVDALPSPRGKYEAYEDLIRKTAG